jgi:hypothetical protein
VVIDHVVPTRSPLEVLRKATGKDFGIAKRRLVPPWLSNRLTEVVSTGELSALVGTIRELCSS